MSDNLKMDAIAVMGLAKSLADAIRRNGFMDCLEATMVHERVGEIEARLRRATVIERGEASPPERFEAEQFELPIGDIEKR